MFISYSVKTVCTGVFSLLLLFSVAHGMEQTNDAQKMEQISVIQEGEGRSFGHALSDVLRDAEQEIKHTVEVVSPEIAQTMCGELAAVKDNQHKNDIAHVRCGGGISEGERNYCQNRMPQVRVALE